MDQKRAILLALSIFGIVFISLVFIITLKDDDSLYFDGVRIYDAVRKYEELARKGFAVTAVIEGKDSNGPASIEAEVVESNRGFLVVEHNNQYRIVEGPLGRQDIRASSITFKAEEPVSLELSYDNINSLDRFYEILDETDRFRGEISFKTDDNIDPILLQRMKNLNFVIYNTDNDLTVTYFSNGATMQFESSVNSGVLADVLSTIDDNLEITDFLSGRIFVFIGANDYEEAAKIASEKGSESFRIYDLR